MSNFCVRYCRTRKIWISKGAPRLGRGSAQPCVADRSVGDFVEFPPWNCTIFDTWKLRYFVLLHLNYSGIPFITNLYEVNWISRSWTPVAEQPYTDRNGTVDDFVKFPAWKLRGVWYESYVISFFAFKLNNATERLFIRTSFCLYLISFYLYEFIIEFWRKSSIQDRVVHHHQTLKLFIFEPSFPMIKTKLNESWNIRL